MVKRCNGQDVFIVKDTGRDGGKGGSLRGWGKGRETSPARWNGGGDRSRSPPARRPRNGGDHDDRMNGGKGKGPYDDTGYDEGYWWGLQKGMAKGSGKGKGKSVEYASYSGGKGDRKGGKGKSETKGRGKGGNRSRSPPPGPRYTGEHDDRIGGDKEQDSYTKGYSKGWGNKGKKSYDDDGYGDGSWRGSRKGKGKGKSSSEQYPNFGSGSRKGKGQGDRKGGKGKAENKGRGKGKNGSTERSSTDLDEELSSYFGGGRPANKKEGGKEAKSKGEAKEVDLDAQLAGYMGDTAAKEAEEKPAAAKAAEKAEEAPAAEKAAAEEKPAEESKA